MTLLEFARGPALQGALIIFVFGIFWRLIGALTASPRILLAPSRRQDTVIAGFRAILTRSWPLEEFHNIIWFQHYSGYIWHISFFIVLFFFQPHIAFFTSLTGLVLAQSA